MLARISVKKPYYVVVGIILVLVLGVISFTRMTTDLLPSMNFPYVIVYVTDVGATPEQIEADVTRPMESSFATLTDIKKITSQSRDNVSLVVLQFNDTADMNTAMIEINSDITALQANWSDSVGAPVIMKINPDMMPVSIVSVSMEDMDILELSRYVNDTLIPKYESINGVAQVSASGLITEEVDVTIEQDRIDVLNNAILRDIDAELADAEQQLNDAQAQISEGKAMLASQKKKVLSQLNAAESMLDGAEEHMAETVAGLKAQRDELQTQLDQVSAAIAQLESLPTLTDEQKALVRELQTRLGELEAQKTALQEELQKVQDGSGTDALNAQIAELEAHKQELQDEKERLEKYIQDLKDADGDSISADIARLEGELETAKAAEEEARSALDARQAELDSAKANIQTLKDQIRDREGEQPTDVPADTDAPTEMPTEEPTDEPAETEPAYETEKPTEQETELPDTEDVPIETEAIDFLDNETSESVWTPFFASAEERSLDDLKRDLAEAEAGLPSLEADVTAAQKALDEKKNETSRVEAELQAKRDALDGVASGDMKSRIDAAEAEISSLDTRMAAVDLEIAGLKELGQGEGSAAGAILAQIAALDQQIDEIKASDAYKAIQLIIDDDQRAQQYAQAVEGKAQLEAGIAQLDSAIEKLEQGIIPGGTIEGYDQDMTIEEARAQLAAGRSMALSAFADAEAQLNDASAQLAEARKEFEDARDKAYEEAGLDGIITMETVAAILGAQNMSMPAGYVYDANEEQFMVRVGDKFRTLEELRRLKLFSLGLDSVDEIRLTDVARVEVTDDRDDSFTKVDGMDGILLSIEKQSTYSTTDVADRVAEMSRTLMAETPALSVVDMFNQGDYINIIVDSVLGNLIWGGLLAVIVLLIFLLDWRPTLIVAMSIPLSVVAAFVCMYFTGITLNVLSLSGLALGIGMLVDNSIVAIENIFRLHNEEKVPILHACVLGINQVGGSLFASTLTTVCVFLPVVFVTGMAHDLFIDLGLTIAYSLLASLIVAMTVVPSMAAGLMKKNRMSRENGLFARFQRGYVKLLRGALRFKPLVLLIAVALLVVCALQVPRMGISFMPQVNSTQMTASYAIDDDADEKAEQEKALTLMGDMMTIPGIQTVGLSSGAGIANLMGSSNALTYYIIVDEDAGRANVDIARDIQAMADKRDMELSVETSTMDISMLTGSGISIDITGEETDELTRIARDVAEIVRGVNGTTEVSDGLEKAVPQLRVTVDKEAAADKNLTVGQVLQAIATKLAGKTEITQVTFDGTEMSVYIIDGRNQDITPDDLGLIEMEVTQGDTSEIVLVSEVADITEAEGFSTISRSEQKRIVSVSFQAAEGESVNLLSDRVEEAIKAYSLPDGYEVSLSGENETVMEIMRNLIFMVIVAVVLIFLIMVGQFQSFKSPFIVMFTIPLAFTGGLLALMLTGMDLSIVAVIGFLVLCGVIVNNGIVFVDTVNQLRVGGMKKKDALVEAGRLRLRPILMTALTTILGMSTMALGSGMGAEMMQPMAVVVVGGLSYATLMTLFIVPCMYDMFNGEKMSVREIRMAEEAAGMAHSDDEVEEEMPKPVAEKAIEKREEKEEETEKREKTRRWRRAAVVKKADAPVMEQSDVSESQGASRSAIASEVQSNGDEVPATQTEPPAPAPQTEAPAPQPVPQAYAPVQQPTAPVQPTAAPIPPMNPYGQMMNPYGQMVNQYGQMVNAYGQTVNQYGQPVNAYGQPVNQYGQPVNAYGQPVNQYGQPVDPYGNPLTYATSQRPAVQPRRAKPSTRAKHRSKIQNKLEK